MIHEEVGSLTGTTSVVWKQWLRGASPWKGPLLALLLEGPGHPYELRRRLIDRLGEERSGKTDLYRLLKEAEALGLATSREGKSERKRKTPVRRYDPTELTANAVSYWMESPVPRQSYRSALRIRLAVAREEDAPALLRACDECERQLFKIATAHKRPFATDTWAGVELELARLAIELHVKAEVSWLEAVRGHILDFTAGGHCGPA